MELILASEWEDKSQEWLIPFLLCDSLTLLSGEPKSGKTSLACHLVRSLITKEEILGFTPTAVRELKVAWMGFDFKWQREVKGRLPDLKNQIYFSTTIDFKEDEEWKELGEKMMEIGINFLVIDHLYGMSASADLDRQNQIQEVFRPIMRLIESTGTSVLLLTQGSKNSGGRAAHSVASEGLARWLLRLSGTENTKTLTALGNNGETKKMSLKLSPFNIQLKDYDLISKKTSTKAPDGGLPERARFVIENAPEDAKLGVKALGHWLSEQDLGINTKESGRSAINNLINGGLLARQGKRGKIIAGPKLVA